MFIMLYYLKKRAWNVGLTFGVMKLSLFAVFFDFKKAVKKAKNVFEIKETKLENDKTI